MQRDLESWLNYIAEQHWQTIDMGLARMHTMVERMDLRAPHQPDGQIVTIAGTNGKGSTAMALEHLLTRAGLQVGTTLSPHLLRFNERIRIGGRELADKPITEAFTQVEDHRGDLPLTYFEFAALAALWCFKQAQVDVCILEIGLGGRLDAFNALDATVAIITSIGLDHQEFLGDNVEDIGREKAGILRPGQKVVLGPNMPNSVMAACSQLNLAPQVYGEAIVAEATDGQWHFCEAGRNAHAAVRTTTHLGTLAGENMALAIAAARHLVTRDTTLDIASLGDVTFPGRLQCIQALERRWVLDVAHNPSGVEFLRRSLRAGGLVPALIICGMLRNKDHAGVAQQLAGLSVPVVCIDTRGERGFSADSLTRKIMPWVAAHSSAVNTALLDQVRSATVPGDVILVMGSFNAVEQMITWLNPPEKQA